MTKKQKQADAARKAAIVAEIKRKADAAGKEALRKIKQSEEESAQRAQFILDDAERVRKSAAAEVEREIAEAVALANRPSWLRRKLGF